MSRFFPFPKFKIDFRLRSLARTENRKHGKYTLRKNLFQILPHNADVCKAWNFRVIGNSMLDCKVRHSPCFEWQIYSNRGRHLHSKKKKLSKGCLHFINTSQWKHGVKCAVYFQKRSAHSSENILNERFADSRLHNENWSNFCQAKGIEAIIL